MRVHATPPLLHLSPCGTLWTVQCRMLAEKVCVLPSTSSKRCVKSAALLVCPTHLPSVPALPSCST